MARKKVPRKEEQLTDQIMHDLLLVLRQSVRKFAHEIVEESKKRQKNPSPAKRKRR